MFCEAIKMSNVISVEVHSRWIYTHVMKWAKKGEFYVSNEIKDIK